MGNATSLSDDRLSTHDLFICHASEDKEDVARPLARILTERGAKVWLDELELTIGDSLSGQIEAALVRSRFGVVILSSAFFAKQWPQRELAGLAAREIDGNSKVILPVWHRVDHHYIAQRSPILADRLGAQTSTGLAGVAQEILRALERANVHVGERPLQTNASGVVAPAEETPQTSNASRRDMGKPSRTRLWGVVLLSFLLTALAGFAVAQDGHGSTYEPLSNNASNRTLEASFPASWHRSSSAPRAPGVPRREPLIFRSSTSNGALVIGETETDSPTLLPTGLISAIARVSPPEVVLLGGKAFYRYSNLTPRGGGLETVYALPTSTGIVLGMCALPRPLRPRSLTVGSDCERILGSLKLTSSKPLPLGLSSTYAATLSDTISRLNAYRAGAAGQLNRATTASSQTTAAEHLADGYASAAKTMRSAVPGPPERSANIAIVQSLRRIAQGYASIANGAHTHDESEFSRGRRVVAAGTAGLTLALARLSRLGYRFIG